MKFFLLLSLLCTPAFAGSGLRYEKTVLEGALIRAGGPGNRHSLSNETVKGLCEAGVRKAFYLYPTEGFSNRGTHSCSRGSIEYTGGNFRGSGVGPILQEVHASITRGTGPVLVHCWNGWHAAGEVAAYALQQFCDWSGARAADYWAENIADRRNLGKYGKILSRIRAFKPSSELRLSASQQARVCP